jgi:hypothetical protein
VAVLLVGMQPSKQLWASLLSGSFIILEAKRTEKGIETSQSGWLELVWVTVWKCMNRGFLLLGVC